MSIGSAPSSTTRASPTGRIGAGAVTAIVACRSRLRSTSVPVNVSDGCRAMGRAPRLVPASRTSVPYRPEQCMRICPAWMRPRFARPVTKGAISSSGTAMRTSSARSVISSGSRTGTPGSISSARSRLAAEVALTPMIACPACRQAAPMLAPTRPQPMIPMPSLGASLWLIRRPPRGSVCGWCGRSSRPRRRSGGRSGCVRHVR